MSLVRQQQRRDTTANWELYNPVLLDGEFGIDTTVDRIKLGDGITAWDDLPYTDASGVTEATAAAQIKAAFMARFVDASDYGFAPTATAAANDAGIAAAIATGRRVFAPRGNYHISAPITGPDGFLGLHGEGPGLTNIIQDTTGAAVLKVKGQRNVVGQMSLSHATPATNTHGNGIELENVYQSEFYNLDAVNSRSGFIRTAGSFFSNRVSNLAVSGFYERGIDISNPGSTGSVWTNIYVQNFGNTSTQSPVKFGDLNDSVVDQLNIEHGKVATGAALDMLGCTNMTLSGVHIEDVSLLGYGASYVQAYGSKAKVAILGLALVFSNLAPTGADAGGGRSLIRAAGGSKIHVTTVHAEGNTNTGATVATLASTETGNDSKVWLRGGVAPDIFTAPYSGDVAGDGIAAGTVNASNVRRYRNNATSLALTSSFTDYELDLGAWVTVTGTYLSPFPPETPTGPGYATAIRVLQTGLYLPGGQVMFTGGAAGKRGLNIKAGSTSKLKFSNYFAGAGTIFVPGSPIKFTAGDVVTIAASSDVTGVSVFGQYDEHTSFGLTYLGPA